MKKIKTILLSGFAVAATIATFTLSVKDNSLESLRANAKLEGGTKCVATTNCDCQSDSTGTIYNGYKKQPITGN
ncbi:MAG: hypothetical protein QM564_04690 [Bergeyella sp.]